jgi:hypothetical protein
LETLSEQTLTSLAVLTVNWNHGQDVIDSFVPLVADCIRKDGDKPVSAVELQKAVRAEVGMKIPMGALEAILARCAKRGLVRRENKVFVPQRKELDANDYASEKAEAARKHGCLLEKLRAFASETYGIEWSEAEADSALLGYLQENTVPVLVAATEGDPLPRGGQSRRTKHVLSAFAGHLSASDPEGFECLETVVKGHVLSTVLFYPDLGQMATRFSDLDVYCDTPFLLRAIGYTEDGLHAQCVDLVELLRDLGANLKCFHHTREEVVGVLEGEAGSLRAGRTTGEYTSKVFRLNEVEEMIIRIDKTFGQLDIEVVDTPAFTAVPDEVALEELIKSRMDYARDRAREKDVKSLAAIARLRGVRRMEKFESAKAIFVTTNTSLARASSAFFRDVEGAAGIPICMPVAMMTRLAWVKKPMAAPDIPRNLVIASSYAAMNPPPPLWREYLGEIEKKRTEGEISNQDYHFLRSSQEARRALMDTTFGDAAAFSAGTVEEVLAHAKAAIQAEARAETETERRQRLAAEEEARSERKRREGIERVHHERVERQGRRLGAVVGWFALALVGLVALVGILASIPNFPLLSIKSHSWRVVVWACLGVAVVLGAIALYNGLTLRDLQRAIASRVERWWYRRGRRRLDELHSRAESP